MTNLLKKYFTIFGLFFLLNISANNGYKLWLQYDFIQNDSIINTYLNNIQSLTPLGDSEITKAGLKELQLGLKSMLGSNFPINKKENKSLIFGTKSNLDKETIDLFSDDFKQINDEGFIIKNIKFKGNKHIIITGKTDVGVLYGVFKFLQLIQTNHSIDTLNIIDSPNIDLRMLNHWDNLDRTVERGYAGFSLWNWQKLPGFIDQRYIDYARANASIGINGTVLTNVNSNALILTPMYLEKVAALANVFRPYGIKVYLTARFSAPIEIGGLQTADPLNEDVQKWWNSKTEEIYKAIPDFGGFLVKANSEGQPGPQNYDRNHVDGANMLAKALKPHSGVVIWRAFVYSEHDASDRAKQAYTEFVPYDGQFMDNVLIQSKNGPIDFQPREPFHPMFGAMPKTPIMMEFQITQEYLGFSSHLVFLPKLYEEVLQSDTYTNGKGSTVSKVIDGSLHHQKLTGMAGVSNIGNDQNWTGHPFAQANWYGFGRLAWNPNLKASDIAEEWLKLNYSNNPNFIENIKPLMLLSREAVVNYMMPFGLHHLFDTGHHYGPGPWVSNLSRPEWNPTYYHKADKDGIGFNRTSNGSNATGQYSKELRELWNDPKTCPDEYLLWFHHLSWDFELKSGHTLWDGLSLQYQEGVNQVKNMMATWEKSKSHITENQYNEVQMLLNIQLKEAVWWKDACLSYFQTFSKKEFPNGVEKPLHTLEYYQSLKFPFAPGIKPSWD